MAAIRGEADIPVPLSDMVSVRFRGEAEVKTAENQDFEVPVSARS